MENMVIKAGFWNGRRVFLTGHTGFKGSWLCLMLSELGASVYGYALAPDQSQKLFYDAAVGDAVAESTFGDVRSISNLSSAMDAAQPEVVFHLAAQPLVLESYNKPADTYEINVMGTVNLLEAARRCQSVRVVVNVTTDKVYENREWSYPYREIDRLGGYDPYSNSKTCSELVTSAYRDSFFPLPLFNVHRVAIATARSGNVIGGGDWAADRIVPDAVRAFSTGRTLSVRSPDAIRPWQHVLDPLRGYLMLAQRLFEDGPAYAGAWNFGPSTDDAVSVRDVVSKLAALWGGGLYECATPAAQQHETNVLRLDSSKSRNQLKWQPLFNVEDALRKTAQWYKSYCDGVSAGSLCRQQIGEFGAAF